MVFLDEYKTTPRVAVMAMKNDSMEERESVIKRHVSPNAREGQNMVRSRELSFCLIKYKT